MSQLVVFVEGEYDEKIINALGFGPELTVIRSLGKKGLKAYMQGYLKGGGVLHAIEYVGFRDRDFDYPVPTEPGLIIPAIDKGKILVTYRTTIENYLLTPENYLHFLQADQQKRLPQIGMEQFAGMLKEAAKDIRFFQAARHALGAARKENQLETSWLASSGVLPPLLTRESCKIAAIELLEQYGEKASLIADQSAFHVCFESFCEHFNDSFFESNEYLIWFQGKDLATSFSRKISESIPNFPIRSFYKTAILNFDYTLFPDLVQLREHLDGIIKTTKA